MRIVINNAHQRFGGAIQVALSFINECLHFPEHDYYVWVGPGVRKSLLVNEFPDNFHFTHFDFGLINLQNTFRINRTLQKQEQKDQPDVIIVTSGPSYFHSQAPQVMGFNLPLYIYPESPFVQQLSASRKLRMILKKQLHFYFFKRDATAYVVQTDDVNQRVRNVLGTEKVYTVTNTCSSYYEGWKKYPDKLPKAKPGIFRFVTISAYYKHKDLKIIPKVLTELQKREITNVEFVLTLNPQDFASHIGEHKGIHNVGPVKPQECPSLYNECDGTFLPTLAECFSASYPEAMKMEKPIVTTDLGFARSICGAAALYYQAQDPIAASDAIAKLIKDTDLQGQLKKAGKEQLLTFDSPRERAAKYLKICKELTD